MRNQLRRTQWQVSGSARNCVAEVVKQCGKAACLLTTVLINPRRFTSSRGQVFNHIKRRTYGEYQRPQERPRCRIYPACAFRPLEEEHPFSAATAGID